MVDLQELQKDLQAMGSPLTLEQNDSRLPQDAQFLQAWNAFLATVPGEKLTLTPGADGIAISGSVLTISGSSGDAWPVQGLEGVSITLATAAVTVANTNGETVVAGTATGSIPFDAQASASASLAQETQPAGAWQAALTGSASGLTPTQMLTFGKSEELPFEIPQNLDLLNQALTVEPGSFGLSFSPNIASDAVYTFAMIAPDASWSAIPNVLEFSGLEIQAVVTTNSVAATLIGQIQISSGGIVVGARMDAGPVWTAFVRPPDGKPWPGLVDLATWIGNAALGTSAQNGFANVDFDPSAFDLALTGAVLTFDWNPPAVQSLALSSVLTVAGLPLDLVVTLPNLTIVGSLHGDPVPVTSMISACGFQGIGLPAETTVVAVAFTADLNAGVYSASATLDDVWQAGPFSLESLVLSANYAEATGIAGGVTATLTLGNTIEIQLSAQYAGGNTGWVFSGSTLAGTTLAIGDLIAALTGDLGLDGVPAPIQSLSLTNVTLDYTTGTGAFDFGCEGDFTVNGQAVKVLVTASVVKTDNAPRSEEGDTPAVGGTKGYSATFGGSMFIGDYEFDLRFNTKDTGSSAFVADYVAKGDSGDLRDLVGAIAESVAQAIPSELDIDLRQAKAVYLKPGAGDSQASDPSDSLWALGMGLQASLNLSGVPGIGSVLKESLALNNLQILYAFDDFSEGQAQSINDLLPTGVEPLPITSNSTGSAGPAKGLAISGVVAFGDVSFPLSLTPGGGGTDAPVGTAALASTAFATAEPSDPIKWIDVNKSFGILQVDRVGVEYQDNVLSIALDAGIAVGPISFTVLGLSVGSPLNAFEPQFGITGLGLSYSEPPLSIGGAFIKTDEPDGEGGMRTSFYGEVMVQAATFGFTVIGGWSPAISAKKIPASLFLFTNVQAPLGGPPFLYVTGLAGGFGVHRSLRLPNIKELPSYPLLPHNAPKAEATPAETVENILPVLERVFTPATGQYWFALGVQFTSFEMVSAFVLVTVAFGTNLQVGLLGSASASFPPDEPYPVAYVEIYIVASYSSDTGLLAIEGCLSPASFVYAGLVHLSGGFAFYTWVSGAHKGDFVMSLGGYGPGYDKPAHYPDVPRLAMSFDMGPFQVLGQAYFALTPGMFMAGIAMQATWSSGSIKAWFDAGVDFFIVWAPFHYQATASINIGVTADVGLFTIDVQVGADLTVWGPSFGGKAHVDLDVIEFTLYFGADPAPSVPLGWSDFSRKFLPAPAEASGGKTTSNNAMWSARSPFAAQTSAPPPKKTPIPNGNVVMASAPSGCPRKLDDHHWVMEPNGFVIEISSSVPVNYACWNDAAVSNNLPDYGNPANQPELVQPTDSDGKPIAYQAPLVWNPTLYIKPMSTDALDSYLYITLEYDEGQSANAFRLRPVLLNAASALWGPGDEPTGTSAANDSPQVLSTLAGFQIMPPIWNPTVVRDVPLADLLFEQGNIVDFAYSSSSVATEFTLDTTSQAPDSLTIDVDGEGGTTLDETGYILSAVAAPWVEARRNPILDDLVANGFQTHSSAEIHLGTFSTQTILTDWPQVQLLGA